MSIKPSPTLYGISDAAQRAGVAENTLRRYDQLGVISPQRDSTGKRLFTDVDIARARQHHERNRRHEG